MQNAERSIEKRVQRNRIIRNTISVGRYAPPDKNGADSSRRLHGRRYILAAASPPLFAWVGVLAAVGVAVSAVHAW